MTLSPQHFTSYFAINLKGKDTPCNLNTSDNELIITNDLNERRLHFFLIFLLTQSLIQVSFICFKTWWTILLKINTKSRNLNPNLFLLKRLLTVSLFFHFYHKFQVLFIFLFLLPGIPTLLMSRKCIF